MKSQSKFGFWLSLCLLFSSTGQSHAQTVGIGERADEQQVRFPEFLAGKPHQADGKDNELRKLLKARCNSALGESQEAYREIRSGRASLESLYSACQRLLQARLDLCGKRADKVALLDQYLELTRKVEELVKTLNQAGKWGKRELHRARHECQDAEIQLLRAKREATESKTR